VTGAACADETPPRRAMLMTAGATRVAKARERMVLGWVDDAVACRDLEICIT
jgi:hypothetical protein